MPDLICTTVLPKVVENLVDPILNFILNPITGRITVVRKCNKNVENLKNQVEKLKTKKEHVENYKKDVGRTEKDVDVKIRNWLDSAGELIEAAEKLEGVGDEFAKNECFFQLCPNPIPRYKLSKEAEKNYQDIVQHLEVARGFGPLPLSHVPLALVEGFEEFPSRMTVVEQIMKALRNPLVNMIGVHGTSGMGKTMLVKLIKRKAQQDSLFNAVVMATVTKDRDLKSIQEDIARDLGLDQIAFREYTDRQVADLIKAKLMKVQKFLIILDDVWETELDFEKFGIPNASEMKQAMEKRNEESASGQEDMLCRILLTSRYRDVLFGMMGEKFQVFEVHKLEDDEAWHLFKKIVGSKVESSNFQPIAKEIVEKCLGLPVAIASVGKAMRVKTQQHEWQTVLMELKRPSPEGIPAAIYKPIELSYQYLQGYELKQTFMLCSLLPHDSSVDDLLKYGMGLDLFQMVNTVEETRTRVQTLVSHLKQSSLLVDGHNSLHFDMHDQIRESALSIAFRDHGVLALEDKVDKETLEKLKWISLPNGDIELLANGLQCPHLTFFYLSNKAQSLEVPSEFFQRADGLKVLCLTNIDFKSMSSPIPLIPKNLRSLLLDQCVFEVKDLGAIMGNLQNLEVLSLVGCDIEELPMEMEKLTKLKLLDVSNCTKLKVIPPQLLARLSELEELKMGNSFDQWDDVEERNARLAELTELHKLTALEVRIPNFQKTLFPENLKRFKIFIGIVSRMHWNKYSWDSYSWESSFESSKIMKLKLQGASIKSNDSVKKLLKKTEELYLEGLSGVETLVGELDDEGFQHLKCLQVQNASDIRRIYNPAGRLLPSHAFPILEVLTLLNLEKMEEICHGLTGAAPFKVLRKITVVGCHELKNLFTFSVARQLQLQEITVEDCKNIQQVIDDVEEQGNGNVIIEESEGCKLGSLRSLTLEGLPKLTRINGNCSGTLFNDKVEIPLLDNLYLSNVCVQQIWHSQITSMSSFVQKLRKLSVWHCDNLKYLFTSLMVRCFEQLKVLQICGCKEMDTVIMIEELVENERMSQTIFPKLDTLELNDLPQLIRFCSNCNSLGKVYEPQGLNGSGSQALAALQSILPETEVPEFVFPQVTCLELDHLPNFKGFSSQIYITKWPLLKRMHVEQCDKMKTFASEFPSSEITYEDNQLEKQTQDPMFWISKDSFPCLEELKLAQNDNMKKIWHGQYPRVYFPKLKTLEVLDCSKLVNLVPSLVSFKKLQGLEISKCHEIANLVRYSTATNFVQLQRMSITNCDWIEEIVTCLEDDVNNGIIFNQLKHLQLSDLPRLASFCTGRCDLEFPSLKEVIVMGCPQMKYFSIGETITEDLQNVQWSIAEKKKLWVDNLNSTIQKLFIRKVGYSELQNLKLFDFLKLIEIWNKTPEEIPFENLRYLEVCNCSNLSYLLTPSMGLSFVQLKDLKVKDCVIMKQVIMVIGVEEVVESGLILFPQLESISLESCTKLSSFYVGSNTLKFPMLEKITIKNCLKMVRFVSKFSSNQEKEKADVRSEETLVKEEPDNFIAAFFCNEVEIPLLDTLDLCSIDVQQIWHNELSSMSSLVQNLRKLTVRDCGNLRYLFTSSMVKSLVQLEVLEIFECQLMEVVILIEDWEDEERVRQMAFPKLHVLELMVLPQFIKFCGTCNSLVEISKPQRLMNGSGSQVLSPTS